MSDDQVIVVKHGRAGLMTLNRPAALNALSSAMFDVMGQALEQWARDPQIYAVVLDAAGERAFCAGGDLRELRAHGLQDLGVARAFLRQEYGYDWQLECYTKPHVALINGLVLGGGVGISLYGTHRVAGEGYAFGMPETAVGFFPDIGASRLFGRMPGAIGLYLALTGRSLGAADAYQLGLVTHCIAAAHFPAIKQALSEGEPVDQVLDALHRDPGKGELNRWRQYIDAIFSASTLPEILARATGFGSATGGWSLAVVEELRRKSPTALHVAHQLWRRGSQLSLRGALELEYRVAANMLEHNDFFEGIRALLVDKDKSPRWQPADIEAVGDRDIEQLFANRHEDFHLAQRALTPS
jgi:enoyl-CoA hydratase